VALVLNFQLLPLCIYKFFSLYLYLVLRLAEESAIESHCHMQCEKQETGCLDRLGLAKPRETSDDQPRLKAESTLVHASAGCIFWLAACSSSGAPVVVCLFALTSPLAISFSTIPL
jgi:hypothetical protein